MTSPEQYGLVIEQLKKYGGGVDLKTRLELARAVFRLTSRYDKCIAQYLEELEID